LSLRRDEKGKGREERSKGEGGGGGSGFHYLILNSYGERFRCLQEREESDSLCSNS